MIKRRESQNLRMTSVMVKPEVYNRFVETLPRTKSVGEALREYMESVVEETEKAKKATPPARGAINYLINKPNKDLPAQTTLDIFAKEKPTQITNLFDELKQRGDIPTIRNFTRNCQIGYDIGKTYFRTSKNG